MYPQTSVLNQTLRDSNFFRLACSGAGTGWAVAHPIVTVSGQAMYAAYPIVCPGLADTS